MCKRRLESEIDGRAQSPDGRKDIRDGRETGWGPTYNQAHGAGMENTRRGDSAEGRGHGYMLSRSRITNSLSVERPAALTSTPSIDVLKKNLKPRHRAQWDSAQGRWVVAVTRSTRLGHGRGGVGLLRRMETSDRLSDGWIVGSVDGYRHTTIDDQYSDATIPGHYTRIPPYDDRRSILGCDDTRTLYQDTGIRLYDDTRDALPSLASLTSQSAHLTTRPASVLCVCCVCTRVSLSSANPGWPSRLPWKVLDGVEHGGMRGRVLQSVGGRVTGLRKGEGDGSIDVGWIDVGLDRRWIDGWADGWLLGRTGGRVD
ncbi:hypothetical protein DFP72DRAFT_859485 [Ephemerocybe angulata]|uniref:Uncharacterized protein n=1 Tax=Ephemerocybe angulata TaxID=980116 RepID=A0A8H6HC60_9AGAR|nr:hypothetical protein DFP72DRAFT_859485 [Tulosesus angulatus]